VTKEPTTTVRSGMPRPVVALVVVLAVLAVAGLLLSLLLLPDGPAPPLWQVGLCLGLLLAASVPWLSVRIGSQRVEFLWFDGAFAVALMLLPLAWVVPAAAVGASTHVLRQRRQPIKALFNVSSFTVGAVLAVAVALLVGGQPLTVTSPRDLGAVLLAAFVLGVWTDLSTATVLALAQRRRVIDVWRTNAGTNLAATGGNLAATATLLLLVRLDPRILLVAPALLICLRQAYEGRLRGREERESWQGLLEATRALADLDERIVLERAVTAATRLFRSDGAEVELAGRRLVRGNETGVSYDGPPDEAPERSGGTTVDHALGRETSALGTLRLVFDGPVTLNDRERAMLGAVAAELHSALVNAARHATARYEATHDPLTGLPNRAGLLAEGGRALREAAGAQVDVAVVLLDIRGFREIVDTLGHAAGDAVLRHVAGRLAALTMPGELAARLDGEFAVLLPKLTDPAQASHRADVLIGGIGSPASIGGTTLALTGVAGIAYAPRAGVPLHELLRQAGVALHSVQSSPGRVDFYAPERDVRSVSRLVLASELRAALRGMDQLDLVYQPILDLHTGEAIAAEALVRWRHPARGTVPPEDFLPVVEHAGLLPDLTRRVLDIALDNAADWTRHGIDVPVAINVSPRTLLDHEFPGEIAAALSRHRVPAGRLTLEISETSVVSHLIVVDRVLEELRDLGVRLALDDFGTGWSSLSHLARIPVHEVKIAAEFTERLLSSPQHAAVVRGTLEIARALDLRAVAAGVTGAIQRATLVSLGCHAGQGDHLFPPLPADRIGPALWSSSVRAQAASEGADVIPLSQRRGAHD
jgi:diguanylate cyclase (GGDEF)-like protein